MAMKKLLLAGLAALFLATGTAHAKKMTSVEPALPPYFSGVWCYNKFASRALPLDSDEVPLFDVYSRAENIPECANRGGFTIWPNGRGYTFGRFDVVRNSCKFEQVNLIKSSRKGETYKA